MASRVKVLTFNVHVVEFFGKGTYFAENAAKIDHYSTEDARWHKKGQSLHEMHKKLFSGCLHPKRVRYALVCRVLLGRIARIASETNGILAK